MSLLLDTHAFLWYIRGSKNLPERHLQTISSGPTYLSLVTPWELAIKLGKNRLGLEVPLEQMIRTALEVNDFKLLPIELGRVLAVQSLPHYHGDPFDRLLIAQAQIEGRTILSRDAAFDRYGIDRLG